MKKLGILTFHDGINHGAFMQVFSLKRFIEENFDYKVSVINYKELRIKLREDVYVLQKGGKIYDNFRKIIKFKKQQKKHLNLTRYYSSVSSIDADFDVVVFGSDEVWNLNNPAFKNRTNFAYFGGGLDSQAKFVAYAPSFGSTIVGDDKIPLIRDYIRKFNFLSVRDINSSEVINSVSDKPCSLVCDPTFLIDQNQFSIEPSISDYILVYGTSFTKEQILEVKAFQKKHNKKILSISFYYSWADINIIDVDPFEWIGFFEKAYFIFTPMFHGTVFSLLLNGKFCIFSDPYRTNKFSFMVKKLDLERHFWGEGDASIDMENHLYTQGDSLAKFRGLGKSFLRKALVE